MLAASIPLPVRLWSRAGGESCRRGDATRPRRFKRRSDGPKGNALLIEFPSPKISSGLVCSEKSVARRTTIWYCYI